MREKSDILQTYRRTTQTKGTNRKPGNFWPNIRNLGMYVCLCKKVANPIQDEVES
jgi:hypothetical protein